jgi:hypothetical protein
VEALPHKRFFLDPLIFLTDWACIVNLSFYYVNIHDSICTEHSCRFINMYTCIGVKYECEREGEVEGDR